MAKRFFSYSYEYGFERHDTAEEAKESAEFILKLNRDWAEKNGMWLDETSTIIWGEMRGEIVEKSLPCGSVDMQLEDVGQ